MRTITVFVLILALLVPVTAAAQTTTLNGTIWQVNQAPYDTYIFFATAGSSFIATMLSYDVYGNASWLGVIGTLQGQAAFGSFFVPTQFRLAPTTATATFTFTGNTGTFTTTGASFLLVQSGAFTRVFP